LGFFDADDIASSRIMQSLQGQIFPLSMRIKTELPVWPTEMCRQNGAHLHYRRTISSSMLIEDLAKLPGNSGVLGGFVS
jgi:hypothetical protein